MRKRVFILGERGVQMFFEKIMLRYIERIPEDKWNKKTWDEHTLSELELFLIEKPNILIIETKYLVADMLNRGMYGNVVLISDAKELHQYINDYFNIAKDEDVKKLALFHRSFYKYQ